MYFRKKRSEKESKDAPVYLNDIGSGPMDSTTSTENLVYSNAAELNTVATEKSTDKIYQNAKVDGRTSDLSEYWWQAQRKGQNAYCILE